MSAMTSKAITSSKASTFHGVQHNNAKNASLRGSLTLSESGLCFQPEDSASNAPLKVSWQEVIKHQVSPASYPKALLKLIRKDASGKGSKSDTFQFLTRNGLESARRDISTRLAKANPHSNANSTGGKKRPREEVQSNNSAIETTHKRQSTPPSDTYITHDPIALIATRSALLASDPSLRSQHRLLVVQNGTLSEEDFWETHSRLVADEYAKISGSASKGMASGIKSNLDLGLASGGAGASKKEKKKEESNDDSVTVKPLPRSGVIHLGVEEMRQIFLMYPAVHKAYEEKVPLELSEEQFWRKYLESEYFHRDRGRVGGHIGRVNELEKMEMEKMVGKKTVEKKDEKKEDKKDEKENASERMAGDEARLAAAAGSDDIFSRYDQKGPQSLPRTTNLAVGQFDLASTAETERGERYLEGGDLHPDYSEIDSRGARVIDKYNRHWAIVLHPNECSAKGKIFNEALVNDDVVGNVDEGVDREMSELVGFANASENQADHSRGIGEDDGDCLELHLNDVSGYRGKFLGGKAGTDAASSAAANNSEMTMKYTKYLAATLQATTEALLRDQNTGKVKGFADAATLKQAFPEPKIGRGLLEALSKKMAADSQTEADVQKLADSLPEEFRNNLATYFRRSSELLRHFFGLRSVFNDDSDDNGGIGVSESQRNRLTSIVKGMEKVHGEMYELTRNLPLVESKMFKPIMDNLDWAFKLHREDSSKGGKGGFVPVARGFVSV